MALATSRIILVDSRERKPLPFPANLLYARADGARLTVKLTTVARTLPTSDYLLEGGPGVLYASANQKAVALERKGSLSELYGNLLTRDGRSRFERCCSRLSAEFARALLLIEGHPSSLYGDKRLDAAEVGQVLAEIHRLVFRHRLDLHFIPSNTHVQRVHVAQWAASYLLAAEEETVLWQAPAKLES